jgi:translocation and assembly module TamB
MPNEGARPTSLRRWARRALIASAVLFGVVLLVVGIVAAALGNLQTHFIKSRIISAAAAQGLSLDYDQAAASLTSFRMRNLRVLQPKPDEALAPLASVDELELSYSPWRAMLGGRFRLERGAIRGVHLVVFTDEDGSSSLTRLLAQMPKSEKPKSEKEKKQEPLSNTLAGLSDLKVSIGSFEIGGVTAEAIAREKGKERERATFTGLALSFSDEKGALHALLSTPPAAKLSVTSAGAAEKTLLADARVELQWSQRNAEPRGDLTVKLQLQREDLYPLPPLHEVLRLRASVLPQPAQHKTTLAVAELALLDGAVTGRLDADLEDEAQGTVAPSIREAALDIALDPLRPFVPPAAAEVTALSGSLKVALRAIDLTHGLRIAPGGSAEFRAQLPKLAVRSGALSAQIEKASFELLAKPEGESISLALKMPVESLRAALPGRKLALDRALLSGAAVVSATYKTTGQLTATIASLHVDGAQSVAAGGAQSINASDAQLKLTAKDAGPPFKLPASGEATLAIGNLSVAHGARTLVARTSMKTTLSLSRFSYDAADPLRSTADATLDFSLGATTAQLKVDKRARDATFKLSASAPTLSQVRTFAGPSDEIPWQQIGVTLTSEGKATSLGEGDRQRLEQETTLRVTHAALHGDFEAAADQVVATLTSKGTALYHQADLGLHVAGLSLQGKPRPGEENAKLHAVFDKGRPAVALQFEATGEACPEGKLSLDLAYERARARVTYRIDGELRHLELVPTLLPPAVLENTTLDWATLAMSVHGEGAIDGVVTAMRGLTPKLSRDPLQSIRGAQRFDLVLQGLDYANDQGQSVVLPQAALHLNAGEEAAKKTLSLTAEAAQGKAGNAADEAKFDKLSAALDLALGPDALRAELHAKIGALAQNLQPAYPIGDATFDAVATSGKDGTLELIKLDFDNPAGGSSLSASGNIEAALELKGGVPHLRSLATLTGEERDLHLAGEIAQSLDKLQAGVGATGSGSMRIPFSLDTTDFHFFRAVMGFELKDANLDFTGRRLSLRKLDARIPIKTSFRLDDGVITPLGGARLGVYPRERFGDYQPFLGDVDFVTCESIKAGDSVVGPISANLRFDRNLLALDQLEMSAFGGKITGQLILDLDLAQRQLTDVQFRGDVTGLAPGSGAQRSSEVVDANASLRLNPQRLELEGRIDILRLGRDDLSAMLDAWDPYHADPNANRTRKALAAGYPKHVRMSFHQGFTVMEMEMGGLAAAAGLDPVQLSTGPMLEKYAAPYLNLMKPKKKPEQR